MSRTLILDIPSAVRQQAGQYTARVYWHAGSYEMGQYTHSAERKTGRARSILEGFADDAYLSNVLFHSKGTAGILIIYYS